MVKSPSKYLSREFLHRLLVNRCISESGAEYSEEECQALLIEKQASHALSDYQDQIQAYYDEIDAKNKNESDTIFPLCEVTSQCQIECTTKSDNSAREGSSRSHNDLALNTRTFPRQNSLTQQQRGTMGPIERSLKLTHKPKNISVEQAIALIEEWDLLDKKEKRGAKRGQGTSAKHHKKASQ